MTAGLVEYLGKVMGEGGRWIGRVVRMGRGEVTENKGMGKEGRREG